MTQTVKMNELFSPAALAYQVLFPPDRDQFMSIIFTVFWDNVLLFSKKISETIDTESCAHGQLRGWKSKKCVELIILNLKLNKRNEMFNTNLSNVHFQYPAKLSLLHIHLIIGYLHSWHNFNNLIGIQLQFFSGMHGAGVVTVFFRHSFWCF